MITSLTNSKVKTVRRLLAERRFRQRENSFVAEGSRWLEDVLATGAQPHFCLVTPDWIDKNQTLASTLTQSSIPHQQIDPAIAQAISDTETAPGVFTVLPQPDLPWPTNPQLLLLLDGLQDPGNMGTLIRTATAAGVSGLILLPGCVDPFNPKVTRSTMGTLLRLPLRQIKWDALPQHIGSCCLYLATGDAQTPYTAVPWSEPAALIIGNEAHGVSQTARNQAHTPIYIPMHNQTESLNAAVAGSVILFEAVRQSQLA